MSEVRLIGLPADGSKPFLMAIAMNEENAKRIYAQTHHLYVQPLSGYRLEPKVSDGQRRKRNRRT